VAQAVRKNQVMLPQKQEKHAHTTHIVGWGLLGFSSLILGYPGESFSTKPERL
jgi:hypothetical protein